MNSISKRLDANSFAATHLIFIVTPWAELNLWLEGSLVGWRYITGLEAVRLYTVHTLDIHVACSSEISSAGNRCGVENAQLSI